MPIIALELKAFLTNVDKLRPGDYDDHRWYLKLKCTSCGEEGSNWQYAALENAQPLAKGHGVAHLIVKCQLCGRTNSLEILTDSYAAYDFEKNEEFQRIVKFDCRGCEPVAFDPRVGWTAVGTESGTVFDDIDLNEGEWVDYDEKAAEPTEIGEIEARFVTVRSK